MLSIPQRLHHPLVQTSRPAIGSVLHYQPWTWQLVDQAHPITNRLQDSHSSYNYSSEPSAVSHNATVADHTAPGDTCKNDQPMHACEPGEAEHSPYQHSAVLVASLQTNGTSSVHGAGHSLRPCTHRQEEGHCRSARVSRAGRVSLTAVAASPSPSNAPGCRGHHRSQATQGNLQSAPPKSISNHPTWPPHALSSSMLSSSMLHK